ncbi:hypothetical protein MAUB1S_02954 [Mycolicibacterium aubagnense]
MTPTAMATLEIDEQRRRSRAIRFFWGWLILTTCLSLVGNVVHAWLTAPHATRWLAACVAAVPPTVLLLSVHGLALLAKATGSGTVYRAAVVATGAVAVGAFVLSFVALRDLAVIAGIQPRLAPVLPLVIDLAIGVATLALVAVGDKPARCARSATRGTTATAATDRYTAKVRPPMAAMMYRDTATPAKPKIAPSPNADDPIRQLAVELVRQKVTRKPVETVAAVLAAREQGHALNRIAKQVGIHHSAASRIIAAAVKQQQFSAAA